MQYPASQARFYYPERQPQNSTAEIENQIKFD